jgi:hypothetical protein
VFRAALAQNRCLLTLVQPLHPAELSKSLQWRMRLDPGGLRLWRLLSPRQVQPPPLLQRTH